VRWKDVKTLKDCAIAEYGRAIDRSSKLIFSKSEGDTFGER